MPITDTRTAQRLLQITSPTEVEAFLKEVEGNNVFEDDTRWVPVGGLRSNAGSIEASADEVNPIIERITNSIESVIELRVARVGREHQSPREAIQEFFNVPQGSARLLSDNDARSLADQVVVSLRGDDSSVATIVIRDKGIGVQANNLKDTILSLGQSEKSSKPYLIGMYGQGGSSTFDKCVYSIIVSRRASDCLSGAEEDLPGWTIVRKRLTGRGHVYSYLVDSRSHNVPDIKASIAESIGFSHGTYVAHIAYTGLGGIASQQITNNAFFTFNYRLYDPLLPWTLTDERPNMNQTSRTMRGIPYRVDQIPQVNGIGSIQARQTTEQSAVRHHIEYSHAMSSGSKLRVEWWIIQDEQTVKGRRRHDHAGRLAAYIDRTRRYRQRIIAITRGGQTHAALTAQPFRTNQLREISKSVIVNVSTDDLTFEEGASFFASNRADLKDESQSAIEKAIQAAITLYLPDLRGIEHERQSELLAGKGADDEDRLRVRLDPIIKLFQRSIVRSGSSTSQRKMTGKPFKGVAIPTYLRFARTEPLSVLPGIPTRVEILTDAADDVVRSKGVRFLLDSNNPLAQCGTFQGKDGRYRFSIIPSPMLVQGTRIELSAIIYRPSVFERSTQQPCYLEVSAPPPPWVGNDPPTFLRFKTTSAGEIHVRQGGARISIESDANDDFLRTGGTIEVGLVNANGLSVSGTTSPRRGEFHVNIPIPEDYPIGPTGQIEAVIKSKNSPQFSATGTLIINQKPTGGGSVDIVSAPAYKIYDVKEIPQSDDEKSWTEMSDVLECAQWTGKDVGAFYITGQDSDREIHLYLNVDNQELLEAEKRIARRSSATLDSFREAHRTLLCLHLYGIAVNEPSTDDLPYEKYQEEMIRVNRTLLYAHKEFLDSSDLDIAE